MAQQIPLAELGIDLMLAVEVKQVLEREFDMFFTPQDILTLTFSKLIEMDKSTEHEKAHKGNEKTPEILGMQLLIRIMDNENMTSDTCLDLPTKKDWRKVDAFLLPGIDGCGHIFNPLASKIRPTTTCLQYGSHNIELGHLTIQDYVDYLLPVRNSVFFSTPFFLSLSSFSLLSSSLA